MDIISREEAKEQGLKYYFTGEACKRGHFCQRLVTNKKCVECSSEDYKKWLSKGDNRDKKNSRKREWHFENHESQLSYMKDYRESNPEFMKFIKKRHYDHNTEEILAKGKVWRENNKEYFTIYQRDKYKENPAKFRAFSSKYRAIKIQRTLDFSDPYLKELNEFCISETFQQSEDLKRFFGVDYHVDHIIPMQGDDVSGLHVWYNLQPLEGIENSSKNNSFVPYWENHITGEVRYNV